MDKYQELSIFVCGSDHADKQALCEDYSAFRKDEHFSAIAVSTGGNESQYFRSYLGARFAVEAALDSLTAFASSVSKEMLFADKRTQERLLRQLEGSIVVNWNEKVNRHLENYPFQKEELDSVESDKHRDAYQKGIQLELAYRANVTAVIATDDYCLVIRDGNGECVLVEKDGKPADPLPVTRREDSYTLCRPNAAREFSHTCSDTVPASIFLVTEGVRRCFARQEDYHAYIQELTQMLLKNPGDAKEYLKVDLPLLSRKGSHDDMCVAAIWSSDKLENGPALPWNTEVEWERDAEWKQELIRHRIQTDEEQKCREMREAARKAAKEALEASKSAWKAAEKAAGKAQEVAQAALDENVIKEAQQTVTEARNTARKADDKAQEAGSESQKAQKAAGYGAIKAAWEAAVKARNEAQKAADEAWGTVQKLQGLLEKQPLCQMMRETAQKAAEEARIAAEDARDAAEKVAGKPQEIAKITKERAQIKAVQRRVKTAQDSAQKASDKAQEAIGAKNAAQEAADYEIIKTSSTTAENAAQEAKNAAKEAQDAAQEVETIVNRIKKASRFKKAALAAAAVAIGFFLFGGKGDSDKKETLSAVTTEAESSLEDKVETENQPETRDEEKESREREELEESIRESLRQESVLAASIKESLEEESRQESLAEESRQESLAEESRQASLEAEETETEPPQTTAAPRQTTAAHRQTTAAPPQTTAAPQTAPPETAPPETAPPETNPPQPETPPAPPQTAPPETSAPSGQSELDAANQLLKPLQ